MVICGLSRGGSERFACPKKEKSEHFHFAAGQPLGMRAGAFIFVYALARAVGEMARFGYVEISPEFT